MYTLRNKEQWQAIFNEQKGSGLTILEYCQKKQLAKSSFYKFRKRYGTLPNNFVQAKITQHVETVAHHQPTVLTIGSLTLHIPSSTSANYLCQLIRGLAL